ncbi:MAG TPA: IPT/TIG domain-containing protein [Dongiaceae bacterium]|nr:IPT/TIG domain-containing protein [Dongiaceae bacterium]
MPEGTARPVFLWALVAASLLFSGCGGGGSPERQQAPPPIPDFSITVSPSSVSIPQGTTSTGIQISVQAIHGFNSAVQIALSGLPSGVTANPGATFSVAAGNSVTLLLGASNSAATGSVTVSVTATGAGLTHSTSLALTVSAVQPAAVPRTAFTRTDAVAALDDPAAEPHHRHIAYDAANKHIFVANRAMNRVEVLSSTDGSQVTQVSIPGASSADLSADGQLVWVGTASEQLAAISTATLQVASAGQLAGLTPIPNTVFDRPEELVSLRGGKLLVRLREGGGSEALLASYDPNSNTLTDLTPLAPQVFQHGVGVIARSADRNRALVASNDATGTVLLLDGNAAVAAGPQVIASGTILYAAASPGGTQFAVIQAASGGEQVLLLDSALGVVASRPTSNARGVVFSSDGKNLFVAENSNDLPLLSLLSAADLSAVGWSADPAIQSLGSEIEETDETGMVFGCANRGVSLLDASQFAAPQGGTLLPALAANPAAAPNAGPSAGGTSVTLTGQNFTANPAIHFGSQNSLVSSSNATQILTRSPASAAAGAVNLSAYFSNGGVVLAPDAFAYGPQILNVLPNAGNSNGGESVAIYGYGFGEDPGKVAVKFGSAAATVQKLEDVAAVAASLGLDAAYPFPLQRLTVTTPAAAAGKSDLSVSAPAGSALARLGFQFTQSQQVFAKPGFYKFLLYDASRQVVYLTGTDHLDVLDLASGVYRAPLTPPGGSPPNALLRQAILIPQTPQVALADFGAQSVYLLNPDTAAGTVVSVGGIQGDPNSGPVRIAATSANTIFVGMASYGGSTSGCSTCLQQMNLSASPVTTAPAPQPQVSTLTSAPLVDSSADGNSVFFAFAAAPGQPMAGWAASAPQQFATAATNISAADLATAADGTFFATQASGRIEIRDTSLALRSVTVISEREGIPAGTVVPGIALHPSGALVYVPFLSGPAPASPPFTGLQGGVDIFDAHSGRLRLRVFLPEPFAALRADSDGLHGKFLTIDENGQRLFALTASGLTVVQLARVPLGIGVLSPANGPSAGGTAITLRGSGFASGATVTIGGQPANVSFVDMNTLKLTAPAVASGLQRVVVTNPDGESVVLEAGYTAN